MDLTTQLGWNAFSIKFDSLEDTWNTKEEKEGTTAPNEKAISKWWIRE